MPTLIIIEGLKIMMFERDHEPPHVHILTADAAALWDIRNARQMAIRGRLTRREPASSRNGSRPTATHCWRFGSAEG